jgi:glycosyltransferase involved in cell wall biosynthesis
MKLSICFFDSALAFDVATPFHQPLGGSQSSLSYLAIELARRGHRVTVLSRLARPRTVYGVECLNVAALTTGLAQARNFDAVIVRNASASHRGVRQYVPRGTPLVLWNGHAPDQPSMQDLADHAKARDWDRIVCVSDWLRAAMIETFRLEPRQLTTIRNAIGPRFENMFVDASDLAAAKAPEPVMAYTSTPFRGLASLLRMFRTLRNARPELRLEVYSDMSIYQQDEAAHPYKKLYAKARSLPGVKYFGAVSQTTLAQALRSAAILSYPSSFAETSCVSVLEALAAGLHVVTTRLGALPETCMGFADFVEPLAGPDDAERFVKLYGGKIVAAVDRRKRDPAAFAEQCFEQVQAVNRTCNWGLRASEWEAAIAGWRRL